MPSYVMAPALSRLKDLAPPALRTGLLEEDWWALQRAYESPSRAYHNLSHIVEVAEVAAALPWEHSEEVFLAILFHDAIYEALRKDNERESAKMAVAVASKRFAPTMVDAALVSDLINLTARHGALSPLDVSAEAALFLDADMSILAAPRQRYLEYVRGVTTEYAAVPRFLFRRKRRTFLQTLLAQPRLFLSQQFHETLDRAARENLRAELNGDDGGL